METFKPRSTLDGESTLEAYSAIQEAIKRFPELRGGTFAEKLDHLETLLLEAGIEIDPLFKSQIEELLKNHLRISAVLRR